ncbi:hypothetical protein SESBI_24028 [Sesbania bispinosa]|nr:hypothetical protein SESBI_24028 [Sesbania bispinosa]
MGGRSSAHGLSEWKFFERELLIWKKDLNGAEELRKKVARLEVGLALLNQEKQDLAQKNKDLSDELSQTKSDKEVVEAALLQEKNDHEASKSKFIADRDQLTVEAADSYDSACNVLKEVVGGVLVDLISGEGEPRAKSGLADSLVETVAEKVTFDHDGRGDEPDAEDLGNAPRT